ncbi:MAG: UbiH/UbiF/VisC/COQ6 family ubiquinone biosynthesis hydroxylase [Gammaproteobacteria bacterium]
MKPQHSFYDVAIVGGGMVGATLACALGDTPLRVAVVDAVSPTVEWPPEGYDLRVSAITRASQRIFETLGAWEGMVERRVSPFRDMHVWDAGGRGSIHFDSADLGEDTLGHIIENRVIQAALHERMARLDNVEFIAPVRLRRLAWDSDAMYLELEDGSYLASSLLVGADGSRSWVRAQAGISVKGWDYQQQALVTYVKTERPHEETAWQRFLPEGPLAFLPLTEGYSSIVWSTTPEQAKHLLDLDEGSFSQSLAEAFEHRLGEIEQVGPRAAYPLRFLQTNAYVRPRLALVGDAAHTMHPLAGQGVNLGLADAASLAEVLLEALAARKGIGSITTLRRYERWRRADNQGMLAAVDGFKRVFGSDLSVVRWARNTGLNLTHSVLPVKNLLMRYAMGLSGDLPRLARGEALRDALGQH